MQTVSVQYCVKSVVDTKTRREVPVQEAIRNHLVDPVRRIFFDTDTGREMSITDAVDRGLIKIETELGTNSNVTSLSDVGEAASAQSLDSVITSTLNVLAICDLRTGEEVRGLVYPSQRKERKGTLDTFRLCFFCF